MLEGNIQFQLSVYAMIVSVIVCLSLLLTTIRVHFKKGRVAVEAARLKPVLEALVTATRDGLSTDAEIARALQPEHYQHFEDFLRETISTTRDIDVSAERKIADVSGFTDHIKARIERSRGWNMTTAVRVLSYLRDKGHIPIFRKVLEEETFVSAKYAAGLGLALCQDIDSASLVAREIWAASEHHEEVLLTVLATYGKSIAPDVEAALREGRVPAEARTTAVKFLSDFRCKGAATTIAGMLQHETEQHVLESCLGALRTLGDESVLPDVLPFLKHEAFALRIEALRAVAAIGGANCLQQIEDLMCDDNWWVRREAAIAVANTGKPGIAHLEAIAEQTEDAPRIAASGVLAELMFNRITTQDI